MTTKATSIVEPLGFSGSLPIMFSLVLNTMQRYSVLFRSCRILSPSESGLPASRLQVHAAAAAAASGTCWDVTSPMMTSSSPRQPSAAATYVKREVTSGADDVSRSLSDDNWMMYNNVNFYTQHEQQQRNHHTSFPLIISAK